MSVYRLALTAALIAVATPKSANAQQHLQYDTVSMDTAAAVSCGFCAGEKFGVVFRELPGGRGLRPDQFPLTVRSVEVALASAMVTGLDTCSGSTAGGTVNAGVEICAGVTPPSGSIMAMPSSGCWPGETSVYAEPSVPVMLSVATSAGSAMFDVMVSTIEMPGGGVEVPAPNTYLRATVTIPVGGSSDSCAFAGHDPPAGVAIRDDDGRIAGEIGYIYSLETVFEGTVLVEEGWYWNESTPVGGIEGDWLVRLNVLPMASAPDAGVGNPDSGLVGDAGVSTPDAGPTPPMDGGTSTMMCTGDTECAGGERCIEGSCRRVSCTAATDCTGGMTCVEGMCRNLCSADSECLGGEVCDTEMGHCVPVGSLDDGGCGCRVGARGDLPRWPIAFSALALLGLVLRSRRRG